MRECCGIPMSIMGTNGKGQGHIIQCMRCGFRRPEQDPRPFSPADEPAIIHTSYRRLVNVRQREAK